ncbi:TIGR02117 family protein [Altericroceibacterium spongiae]|uniref:TIGR02117 family protein n=1 Tax=Altericroceibacterium spongiae TaxID=2320269 RepID=UPI001EE559EB|nr:TIGR02117 family protein [Altericroceibacterium spongiae]
MAAPPLLPLSRLFRALRAVFIGAIAALLLFLLASWIGSSIPRNRGWQEPQSGVTIMVESNGIHTSLIVPLVNGIKDWRSDFPARDVDLTGRPYTHLSISWGEHEVFINTPSWNDLSPLTVMRIIGMGGEGALHVSHYVRPAASNYVRPITLTGSQYARLVKAMERSIPPRPRIRHHGYGPQDVFYDAPGHYTASNTCNQWTSNMLAEAGVRTGWWTPFSGGVMKWIDTPSER